MVFIGGWRPRRRRGYPPYPPPYGSDPYGQVDPYGRPGYYPQRYYRRGGGGGSCLRDLFLVETGCCVADAIGCGPQLLVLAPSAVAAGARRPAAAARPESLGDDGRGSTSAPSGPARAALALIEAYQREISPRRPACCRYSPSCSHYAAEAVRRHGLRAGGALALRRLVRCRPGADGGADPVP